MKKVLLYFCLGMLLLPCLLHAQDPHFSQYFSSPLTFNPAFTGYFDGTHRITFNVRNQWENVNEPYTTGTFSFDTRIMKNNIGSNDKWGMGVHALYDQSNGGIFKNSYISLSTAFNKGLDEDGDQSIGIGVQATVARNSVDFSKISFNNQFDGSGFNLSIPSGEEYNNRTASYTDLNAGILYNYKDENGNSFSIGASMFHILRPKVSFFTGTANALDPRYVVHAGVNLNTGQNDQVFLNANIMQQAGASQVVAGGAYGIGVSQSDMLLYLGIWLRVKDAFYPYIGLRTNDYQIGLSYDIISTDRKAKGFTGSSELSFMYFFHSSGKKIAPCFF